MIDLVIKNSTDDWKWDLKKMIMPIELKKKSKKKKLINNIKLRSSL